MKIIVALCVIFAVAAALPTEELKPATKDQSMELDYRPRDKRDLLVAPSIGLGYAGAYYPTAYAHHPYVPSVSYVSPYSSWHGYNSYLGYGLGWY